MKTINLNSEFSFVIKETHGFKPNKRNALKREVLFILQCLLNNSKSHKNFEIYKKTKNYYLSLE